MGYRSDCSLPPLSLGSLKLGHLWDQAVAVLRAPTERMGCTWTAGCSSWKSRTNEVKLSLPRPPAPRVQSGFAMNKQTNNSTDTLSQAEVQKHTRRSTPAGGRGSGGGKEGKGSTGSWRDTSESGSCRHHNLLQQPQLHERVPNHSHQVTTERCSPQEGKPHIQAPVPGNRMPGSLCSGEPSPVEKSRLILAPAWGPPEVPWPVLPTLLDGVPLGLTSHSHTGVTVG